jgi:cytochrome c-type biogenesis protein CcsB
MIVLLALYAISMAVATFVEKSQGTTFAKVLIYYSPLFFLIQFLLVINFVMIVFRYKFFKHKRWGLIWIHFSFIIILLGAMTTHISGKEGILHLREGEITNQVMVHTNRGQSLITLPFKVELVKFTLTRYPGSMSPSSFESELIVHVDGKTRNERVYMNNVLDVKGYRFFQASYDADEKGTVLSVNQDVVGRNLTYAGYLLLAIGCILCLTGKHTRIRSLFKQMKTITIMMVLMVCNLTLQAATTPGSMTAVIQKNAIPPKHAGRFGEIPVQSTNGRVIPLNTFSSEILRKLSKNTRFGTLNSDRFLLSLFAMPEMWMHVPLIHHSNDMIAAFFSLPANACAYVDMFHEDGSYILQTGLNEAFQKMPAERTGFDKEIIKLDEKVNILHQLFEFQLIRLFPKTGDPAQQWFAPGDDLSVFSGQDSMFVTRIFDWYISEVQGAIKSGDWSKPDEILDMISTYQTAKNNIPDFDFQKIALELKYNKWDIFRWCKTGYLSLGGLLLLFAFLSFFKYRVHRRLITKLLGIGVLIIFHFHMLGMGMRWQISGYAPWSNSYETMILMAWATVFAGLLFARKSLITFALSTIFAGIILIVSSLNWMDPQINPLVPVLKSPWLMFHVAILMAAYGFFGISFCIGFVNLLIMSLMRKEKNAVFNGTIRELSIINEISLIIGLILMTVGTFMGAVWANESWGRYWGWDPKETWALITMIVYAMVTHLHLLRKWYDLWLINLCSVIAFSSVLMTYFGVNYFLSGMHSYGSSGQTGNIYVYLCGAGITIALLAVFSRKNHNQKPLSPS